MIMYCLTLVVIHGLLIVSCGGNTAPVCPSTFYSITIPEDKAVDSVIFTLLCDDADSGSDGSLTYIISTGNNDRKFNILQTGTTANIKTAGTFDFEDTNSAKSFSLAILVRDGGTPPLDLTVTLDIALTPVNEFDPEFTSVSSKLVLKEDTPVGTMILDTKPFDQDLGTDMKNQKTRTSLISPTSPGQFYMDELTGHIYLRHELDFERASHHTVDLQISDLDQPPQRSSNYQINITVHNINENPPVCLSQIYTVKIREDAFPGASLLMLDCDDLESPHLTYTLHKGDSTKFSVEDDGEIKLVSEIDADKEDTFWAIEVEVRDKGAPRLDTFVHVNIFVEDVDDHKPIWHPANNGTYKATIPEDSDIGTFVTTITAIDEDRPGTEHSIVTYAIEDILPTFTIEHRTGKIIVATPGLDREQRDTYKITVSAHSSNKASDKIFGEVIIVISDVNDNFPLFSQDLYSATWPEDTNINTIVVSVHATDQDEGKNGKITYTIIDGNIEDGCRMSIDKKSGKISTDSQLDFEKKEFCHLIVVASDGGTKPHVTTATVIVSVTGVNEFTPTFLRQSYTVSVPEDTAVGTSISKFEATDDDNGIDGMIEYKVASHPDVFTIDKNDGIVRLMKSLDAEIAGSYLVEMQAVDKSPTGKRTGTTTITVVVDDVNEEAPNCKTIAGVEIAATASVGDPVYKLDCTDSDIGPNGDLKYVIEKGNTNSDLTIDSLGNIVVAKTLSKTSYDLEISVFDEGVPPRKTTVFVKVEVNGAPEISNLPKTVDVSELEAIGSVIFTVQTTVSSKSSRFEILSGNSDSTFGINDMSGDIYLISKPDRETTPSYILTIQLTDNIVKSKSKGTLTVKIKDENDNVPRFSNNLYELSVMENVPVSSTVGQVSATDEDDGKNSELTYSIRSGNIGNVFTITEDGEFILDKTLDAESISSYTMEISAVDKGQPALTGSTTVVVTVEDFDEFPSTFLTGAHHSYTISENTPLGALVFAVEAKDADKNTQMEYHITNGNDGSFIINKQSGEIILGKHVDRESVSEYNLTVVADNGAGDTTSTILTIIVSDVNDNDPYCQQNFMSVNVNENATIGTPVFDLQCNDLDAKVNSNLGYIIISGNTNNAFRLDNNSLLVNDQLDYEAVNHYMLVIEIKDQGSPPRSSSITTAIDIIPFYKTPKLYETSARINVTENIKAGTVIYNVDATVDGATEGNWNSLGDLEYILQSIHNAHDFSVDIFTGEITVSNTLDRENIDHYTLNIKCVNRNNRNLYTMFTLDVDVLDLNDNVPVFKNSAYIFLVDEDASFNTTIGTIGALDYDKNENADLEYSIVVGNMDFFILDSDSGDIIVNDSLNAAIKSAYVLSVEVKDNGNPRLSSTAKVMIKVNDINNNRPRFQQSQYYVDVSEDVKVGDIVYQLQADDPDLGSNGKVVYSIASGNDDMKFSVDLQNGTIEISEGLDREKKDAYTLEVIAQDGGVPPRTSTTTLGVTIIDVNDNKPIFSRPIYDIKIDRFIPAGTIMTKVLATDKDKGLNAKVDYFIIDGNDQNFFLLNINTGDIETVAPLYVAGDYYKLKIKAADNGYPRHTARATVNIAIFPSVINTGSHFEFSISENVTVGTLVGTVLPDAVHGNTGKPLFSIIGGDILGVFSVDKSTGIIRTEEFLDREITEEYFLTISIEDSVSNTTVYHKLVHVLVLDVNDNTPRFMLPFRVATIVENSPIGLPVVHFSVTDEDIDENSDVTLEIDPADPLANAVFEMDTRSNNLILKISPDYEMITDLALTVFAYDAGNPSRTSSAEVMVGIIDVKDSVPYDDRPATYFSIECSASAKNGDRITSFTPHDFGMFQSLTDPVSFLTMNEGGVFDIDPLTGNLYVMNEKQVSANARYIMWGIAQVHNNVTWNGAAGILRIDTFEPNKHLVVIEHDVPGNIIQSQRNKLKYAVQDLFPIDYRVGIWDIIDDTGSFISRRKLLSTGSKSLIYVVKDRTTDNIEGIEKDKTFLSQNEILQVLQKSDDGTPALPLTSRAFDTFPVNSVQPYYEEIEETPWYETTLGIAILITVIVTLVLLAIILGLYFYCTRHTADRIVGASKLTLKFPSSSDMDSQNDVLVDRYLHRAHPAPFKPWNASCTSINGTEGDYLSRKERWEDMLEKAGFGFQSLRKPVGPPENLQRTRSDLAQRKINPWLFKYNAQKDDIDQQDKSLTAFKTPVQRYQ